MGLYFPAKDVDEMITQTHDLQLVAKQLAVAKPKHLTQLSPIAPPSLCRNASYYLQVCMKQTLHGYFGKQGGLIQIYFFFLNNST